jgi:hypothetical protein
VSWGRPRAKLPSVDVEFLHHGHISKCKYKGGERSAHMHKSIPRSKQRWEGTYKKVASMIVHLSLSQIRSNDYVREWRYKSKYKDFALIDLYYDQKMLGLARELPNHTPPHGHDSTLKASVPADPLLITP